MSYYNNDPKQGHSSPLVFPSYNNQTLNHKNNLSTLSAASLAKKVDPPLNNLKHRLPLPQESQHHQTSIHQSPQPAPSQAHGKSIPQHLQSVNANTLNKESKDDLIEMKPKKERKNRPGQKFGAKKKSWVWSWFVQDNQDPNVASCDYCGKIITRLPSDKGSPKKLSEHLKTHKLDKTSINDSRAIPIDGNGNTYNPNDQIGFHDSNSPKEDQPQQPLPPQHLQQHLQHLQQHQHPVPQLQPQPNQNQIHPTAQHLSSLQSQSLGGHVTQPQSRGLQDSMQLGYLNQNQNQNRRFLSTDFDNTPYTPQKFQHHLLKFLTENKLSINVIKSHSFQQIVYDLRTDSVGELSELTNLYSTLLEVSRFDAQGTSMSSVEEANVANTIAQHVGQKNE